MRSRSINHSTWISGGAQSTLYVPTPSFFGFEVNTEYRRYFMILPVAAAAYLAALNLGRSRVGRAFIAVRDRDVAAEIIGVDIFRYKLLAFAISSFYAGVTGVLYTYYLGVANYEQFQITVSIDYLAMIIIGGLGSVLIPAMERDGYRRSFASALTAFSPITNTASSRRISSRRARLRASR